MANEQKRGNRETKKPKAKKDNQGKAPAGYLAKGAGLSAPGVNTVAKIKGRTGK